MEIALATAPKDALEVAAQRGPQRVTLKLDAPAGQVTPLALGIKFTLPSTVVSLVSPDSPARKAGLLPGDRIISVSGNGRSTQSYDGILNLISASKGIPLTFEIWRPKEPKQGVGLDSGQGRPPGEQVELRIVPEEAEGRVLIGFTPEVPSDLEKFGVLGAIRESARHNFQLAALTFRIVGRIFTGSASVKTISGPLEIARISGDAARTGSVRVFLSFLALISLQLGVFNLLPIPILDGGVIALLAVESLIRRDLSVALKEKIVQVGFVFLILLMGFAVINDLSKVVTLDKFFR
jgi:regulator of sigma E protease